MQTSFTHPGIVRGLKRVTSEEGFFEVCAVDHLAEFEELLGEVGSVDYSDIVKAKAKVVKAAVEESSAVLLDADYGIGHLVASGAVPARTGIIAAIEAENYEFPQGPRRTILREGWTAETARRSGVDMLKLLWFYRPDLDQDVAAHQRQLVRDLYAQCQKAGLPLVVEPIWFAVPGEDTHTAEWKAQRSDGIISSAIEAEQLGIDVLKVEFPGDVSTADGREIARQNCERLDAAVSVPWVILSAGVDYEQFSVQLEIASSNGASGYMAGRSVWRDIVAGAPDAAAVLQQRLRGLNAIVRSNGRPFDPSSELESALRSIPRGWYRSNSNES
jgi:tagatose 1,6-diphosphate aldolase